MDIDCAVISISKTGAARINAMLYKSIRFEVNEIQDEDAESRVAEIRENMLKNANDSLNALNGVNRDSVLHLL